jgi:methylisocitrate lyase
MAGNTRIHQILDRVGAIAFPGVYDTLSARIAARVGFPMAFISGYSVAATSIGEPDLGLLTQTEMIDRARRICMSVSIPIIVDADTGYGNPLNVHRTVRELILAGAAGCFLEDQVWPKKCGHMRGKKVVESQEYIDKVRAAVDARAGRDFFIVARTDALAVVGLDSAINRMEAAREAGADASFVEARRPHARAARREADCDGFRPDPLPADRPVCRRAGHRADVRQAAPGRDHARRGRPADDVC